MREALKKVRPTEFDDLVALNALYRPGAMDQIPTYARGKRDPESISYPDERLRPILEATKGVILYQEQAMQIAKELAGFSGAKADDLRKAIGKKNREAMAKLKPEFVAGCRASGTSEQVIEWLWATNERSADYSFNKSHAACYALIAYRTAWLKANYPAEYMAALISSVMDTKDKVPFFVAQAEQMGISILPPDVNLSDHEFVVVDGNIRFGLDAVKGVGLRGGRGDQARARGTRGPFRDLWDFCARVDDRAVNKKAIEALIKCGAFGSTGRHAQGHAVGARAGAGGGPEGPAGRADRPGLDLRPRPRARRRRRRRRASEAAAAFATPSHAPIPTVEFDRAELLAAEKESIGLFISAHPLKEVGAALRAKVDCSLGELAGRRDGDWVTVGGMITQAKRIRTKKGDPMMFATLDDLESSVEMLVFGKALADSEDALAPDSIVIVRGRVDHKDREKTCIVAQQIDRFEPTDDEVREAEEQAAKVVVGAERAAPAPRRDRAAGDRARRAEGPARRLPGRVRRRDRAEHVGRPRVGCGSGRTSASTRSAGLHAELDALLGEAIVRGAPEAPASAVAGAYAGASAGAVAAASVAGAVGERGRPSRSSDRSRACCRRRRWRGMFDDTVAAGG